MAITLVQGESRDLVFTATIPADSPITADGLQTAGYRLYFYIKQRLDDTDAAALISKSSPSDGITIESSTVARISLSPSDTGAIAIPNGKRQLSLYGALRFQNTGATIVYIPVHLEEITLLNAV